GATVTVVGTGGLGADLRRVDGSAPAPRDVDLLALGQLLPDVRRAVVLPVDALVTGDLAELADLDLEGTLLAAPTVVGARGASGFGLLHAAGSRLRGRTAASTELRRQGHARHRFDFDAFEVDVLVLDLDEARRRSLVQTYVPYIEEFGLTFREILLLEVGPHRVVLPERWHVVPNRSAASDPLLLHWAEPAKPGSDEVVECEELWLEAAAKVRSRLAPA
ncbi:MAG: glycosyltransferase, partial [Nocardioides sp.]